LKKEIYVSLVQNILQWIDEGIHVIDTEGNTIFYNNNMARLEGLEPSQVINRNIFEVFPSLTHETSSHFKAMIAKDVVQNKTQTYFNVKGKEITTQNSSIPLIHKDEVIGSLEIAKDITQLKELSDKIATLHQKLSQKNQEAIKTSINKYTFDSIVGISEDFVRAVELAKRSSKSSASVLLYGETGTGKEMIAQSIHYHSARASKPFIGQNCAALPEALLEGILFGTVRGSFTGALDRPGLFEQAKGGTLLLDEINSMGMELQTKLLRVLQEGYVRRVGGLSDIPIDVRIIAATNEDPHQAMDKGQLRRDLYYRLNVISIYLPPLRDRSEDVLLLVDYFIKKYNKRLGKNVLGVSQEVKNSFVKYSWPGNTRELQNIIEGAMSLLEDEKIILKEHFSHSVRHSVFSGGPLKKSDPMETIDWFSKPLDQTLENIEKNMINKAMVQNNHNISKAAAMLGIKRQTLQHKLNKYNGEKSK
jgi:arginine utilization regulatory protein